MYSKPQKLAAEFWGTFVVVLVSVAAACGDQIVLARLAAAGGLGTVNGISAGVLSSALAYGAAFAVMTAAVGRVSGGHFNPAISLGFWVTRRLSTFDTLAYCVAQVGGAIVAAYLLRFAIPEAIWRPVAMGTPDLAAGTTRAPAMLIEGLGTFVLTFAVYASSNRAGKTGGTLAALASGLALFLGSLFAAPFTGGALNPARALGPAVVARDWTNQGVYWVGPLAGGVLAAWLCNALFTSLRPAPG